MTVNLALAKQQCRITSTAEDTLISHYLDAATAWVERFISAKLTSSQVSDTFGAFSEFMALKWGPSPASPVVTYFDVDGETQTIADARLFGYRLYPPAGAAWPPIQEGSVITVSYTAGFPVSEPDLDQAVLLLVDEFHENRSAGSLSRATEDAVRMLCEPYRLPTLA
jgi:hypothetical protein